MHIVVTLMVVGRYMGVVGIFTSVEKVIEGIRAYEDKRYAERSGRTKEFEPRPYESPYKDPGEMQEIVGNWGTYVLTMNVAIDWPVGVPLPDPNAPGYTMRE